MSKQQYDHAYLSGRRARQAGRAEASCPMYGMGSDSATLRERWVQGWRDEDSGRARK